MAVKKPSPAIPEPSRQPDAAPPEATHESTQFRILKKGSCPTVSGKSYLNYELGADPNGSLFIRVTENSGGGFFNRDRYKRPMLYRLAGSPAASKAWRNPSMADS